MVTETEEINLQKLEELILDENSIVSCTTAADNLKISIEDGKNILNKFKKDQDDTKSNKVTSVYLLSGMLENGHYAINIVEEKNLKHEQSLFENINNNFVYSIQKNSVINFNAIALSQDSTNFSPCIGSIVGKHCVEKKVKKREAVPVIAEKPPNKSKVSTFFKVTPKIESQNNAESKKVSPKKKINGGISGMFAKMGTKTKTVEKDYEPISKKSKPTEEKEIESTEIKTKENKQEQTEKIKQEKVEEDQNKSNINSVSSKNDIKKPNKTKLKENSKNASGKKRKRIVMNDSDSDDLFAKSDEENVDNLEPDDEQPLPKKQASPVPKNKRRKAVDKTYTDEDGYIVTKTEYVYESASDEEVPVSKENNAVKEEQKSNVKQAAKKVTSKSKKVPANQPTLMSFFKSK